MNGKYRFLIFLLLLSTLLTFGYHHKAYGFIQFEQKVNYEVESTPTSVAVGDLNNDQKVDLAVTNGEANTVSILLGNGDGTFQSALNYNTGEAPEEVVASDFNADEKADLAIANSFDDTLSIFMGKGDGSFEAAVSYDVGEFPLSLVIADFNGDDKDDLAVANGGGLFSSGDVSILLGNGDGTFQAASSLVAGSSPTDICSSDFDADEKRDLAVVDSLDNTVSILLGNGNGTFQSAVNYAVGQSPFGVTVGDFNSDQKEDIAVANSGTNNVSILLGKGDGTFQAAINYGAGKWPMAVEAKDLDQNGFLDLAIANSGDNHVSFLQGIGNGTFLLATNAPAGEFPYALIASDLNEDEWDDLVVVNNNPVDPSASQKQYVVSVILNSSFLPTFTISGKVTGTISSNVPIILSGDASKTTNTNDDGNYEFTDLGSGSYEIIPELQGYAFDPPNYIIENLTSDQSGLDFVSTVQLCPTETIYGEYSKAAALLRNFRDTRLAFSAQGKRYIDLYYRHALEVTGMLVRSHDLMQQVENLLNQLLPAIHSTLQGKRAILSQQMIGNIESLLKKIESQANPGLSSFIHELRNEIKAGGFFQGLRINRSY